MTVRWVGAAGAVVVAVATLGPARAVWPTVEAGNPSVCDANANPVNLNFTLKDMNGGDVALASHKGKVILLDFWATWCGPCKLEIPGFVELQTKYKDKGLVVLGVSVDDPVSKLKPFATQFKMNYPVLVGLDRDDFQEAYGPIWGIPTTFLISRDGKLCKKHTGVSPKEQFENEIKALLGT